MSWDNVRQRVEEISSNHPTWQSHRRNLLAIITNAETLGLSSEDAEYASISNLVEIIPQAKIAIRENDAGELGRLFLDAGTYNNRALRIIVRGDRRKVIKFIREGGMHVLTLDDEQFARIATAVRTVYEFREEEYDLAW